MPYRLEIARSAERSIAKLQPEVRERVLDALIRLQADPFSSPGVKS